MASEAQRKASKKYLSNKKRLNIVVDQHYILEIEYVLSRSGINKTIPEFIRNATLYYLDQINEGKISIYNMDPEDIRENQ